ncbi:MAG: TonB-dependent receptor [Ginsengibacter sp.]
MRKFLFLYFFLLSTIGSAQMSISGKVTDTHGKPIINGSISILNSYDGATTDSLGNYSFMTVEKGNQVLQATVSGYKTVEQAITIVDEPVKFDISLKEQITELKAVVISAGTFEASDQKRATALNPIDIVTTASANGDITSAIKTLPGTQQVGENEGLFVRGGTANESKIFIDGTLVNNFFYSSEPNQATRGRFNPFLFKGTIFSSGGYSALYGQALSSVLLLESIDLPEKTSAEFGISFLAANAGLQKLSKNKKSSWGFTYSYVNLALVFDVIKQKFDYFKIPVLHEGDLNFRLKTSSTGMIKYFGYFSSTNLGFRNQDVDSLNMKNAFGLKNFNMYHNLSWKEKIGKGWKINFGTSFSTNRDDINNELQDQENKKQALVDQPLYAYKNFGLLNKGQYANAKIVFEKKFNGLSAFRFGSEYNYSDEKSTFSQYDNRQFEERIKEDLWSTFAETDIYITNNIAAKAGTRVEHSQLISKWNIAPRISLAYKFPDNSQASIAYGIFYQDPDRKYLPTNQSLLFSKATHYIFQYQKITNQRIFRTEVFYKKYQDLFKAGDNNGKLTVINNKGFGNAKGIEVFWRDKKSIKNFDYWVSYSYLDTKRDFLNYPFAIEPSFAAKHTTSLVLKKFIAKMKTQFNASYTYATGRPYYNIVYDDNSTSYKLIDQGRTKDYNSLSISLNYLPSITNPKAKAFTVFVLSVTNVLGANNVYTYNYSANGLHKVAVTPPSKRFVYLGCFISLGIDRTQDNIDNHL